MEKKPKNDKLNLGHIKLHPPKPKRENPVLTYAIIGLCVLIAVAEAYVFFAEGDKASAKIFNEYGFSVQSLIDGKWWTPITSIFLHGGPEHLFFNMIALFFFGRAVEEKLGWRKFLLIFFAAGFAGDLFTLIGGYAGLIALDIPTIGASAAIFGLMGTAMIVDPLEMVFYPFLIPVPLILVAILYTLYNIAGIVEVFLGTGTNIAYLAHLGGLSVGAVFGFREVGIRRALIIILAVFLIVLAIPFLLEYLQVFDYSGIVLGV